MAIQKVIKTSALCIDVERGVGKNGNKLYSKKTFKNLKTDATPDNIYAVAESIKSVLAKPAGAYSIADSSAIVNE